MSGRWRNNSAYDENCYMSGVKDTRPAAPQPSKEA